MNKIFLNKMLVFLGVLICAYFILFTRVPFLTPFLDECILSLNKSDDIIGYCTEDNIMIYDKPDNNAKILDYVNKECELKIIRGLTVNYQDWYEIKNPFWFGHKTVFILAQYVETAIDRNIKERRMLHSSSEIVLNLDKERPIKDSIFITDLYDIPDFLSVTGEHFRLSNVTFYRDNTTYYEYKCDIKKYHSDIQHYRNKLDSYYFEPISSFSVKIRKTGLIACYVYDYVYTGPKNINGVRMFTLRGKKPDVHVRLIEVINSVDKIVKIGIQVVNGLIYDYDARNILNKKQAQIKNILLMSVNSIENAGISLDAIMVLSQKGVSFFKEIIPKLIITALRRVNNFRKNILMRQPAIKVSIVSGTYGASSSEGCENLCDGNVKTKWRVTNFSSAYAIFKLSSRASVNGIKITTSDNSVHKGSNPSKFALYGSSGSYGPYKYSRPFVNDSSWELIAENNDYTIIKDIDYTTYKFIIKGESEEYQYYKLEVKNEQETNIMQISEFSLSSEKYNFIPSKAVDPPQEHEIVIINF